MKNRLRKTVCAILALCLFTVLPVNAERADLKTLQERLLVLGYEIGQADGILGEKTIAAISLAQTLLAEQ